MFAVKHSRRFCVFIRTELFLLHLCVENKRQDLLQCRVVPFRGKAAVLFACAVKYAAVFHANQGVGQQRLFPALQCNQTG